MIYYIYHKDKSERYGKLNEVHTDESECFKEAHGFKKLGFWPLIKSNEVANDFEALEFAKKWYRDPEPTACPKCMNVK